MSSTAQPDAIAVIDFGSQYTHLIARRIRELEVYSEIIPASAGRDRIAHLNARGIILSGGPASVYDEGAPIIADWVLQSDIPVLGICYGMQAMVHQLGGKVTPGDAREYGHADLHVGRFLGQAPGRTGCHGPGLDEPRRPGGVVAGGNGHAGREPKTATAPRCPTDGDGIGLQFHP